MNSFFLLLFGIINSQAGPSAQEIMQKNEDIRELRDVTSSATLTTGGKGAATRIKEFTWWRKLKSDGTHYNTLTRFHTPAEIKGEGILFLEHTDDESDVLLYLPNFKKIRRVERNNQSGSFMGSEFSYADIATPHAEDFTFKMIKEVKCPNFNEKCWVIESKPKREETSDRTGYSRSVQWIRQSNHMADYVEHFDLEGKLFKKVHASKVEKVDPANNKWMSLDIKVTNEKNGKFTTLQFRDVKVNQNISDAIFTQQNLSKI